MGYIAQCPVYISANDYLGLELLLMETSPNIKPEDFVRQLIARWLKLETERRELRKNGYALRGFQWKNVFLPDGTHLRSMCRGAADFARVVSGKIVTDDGATWTPALFANRHATGRNAWRYIWLRFPGDDHWTPANLCRQRVAVHTGSRQPTTETNLKDPYDDHGEFSEDKGSRTR